MSLQTSSHTLLAPSSKTTLNHIPHLITFKHWSYIIRRRALVTLTVYYDECSISLLLHGSDGSCKHSYFSPANGGHRRRVLVLALPDVVVDTQGRATGACTPPSALPVGSSSIAPECRRRAAWQKSRALSCDVMLETEVGQELRRIADTFRPTRRSLVSSDACVVFY